uniref:DUF6533 domain-containing protein n=1 Tax=Moniliophthora roreri TaxID=221103 RepID=A0A0W0GF30_MONRR
MNYPQSGLLPGGAQLTEGNGEPVRTGWDLRASDYCDLCGIVILYWDHILTFPTEVKYLWKRPRFTSAYLFFLNRYFNTFANVIVIFSLFGPRSFLESTECKPLEDLREGIIIVTQVIVMIIMTLRIYAIYGCNKRLLRVLIGILILLLAGAAVATFYEAGEEEIASIRCHTPRDRIRAIQTAGAWEAAFVYDAILFLLACYKAYRTRYEIDVPLLKIVIRDGCLYFGAMSLTNLANILTFYFAGPFMRGGTAGTATSPSPWYLA